MQSRFSIAIARYWFVSLVMLSTVILLATVVFAKAKSAAELPAKAKRVSSVSDNELKLLKQIDAAYQKQSSLMDVAKTTKIPLLDQERKAAGQLWISNGRLRMELAGAEKTLLVVNKKNLWAVTYPPAEFKDAAVQVIQADTASKKGRSQSFVALLSQGGFLKFFIATGTQKDPNGDVLFFLTPKEDQVDFKRAEVKVAADGKHLVMLTYWDDRDNETRLDFTGTKSEQKFDSKLFDYAPPANADVMRI